MSTPWYKKRQVVGLAAAILIAGAIVAGVLGSRTKGAHSQAPATEAINIKVAHACIWNGMGIQYNTSRAC